MRIYSTTGDKVERTYKEGVLHGKCKRIKSSLSN